MTKALTFWILMLVWLLYAAHSAWKRKGADASDLIPFLAMATLGWAVFGAPVD